MVQKYSEKNDISKETKKGKKQKKRKRTQTVVTKQDKTNVTPEKRQHDIRLEDTSSRHLWLINYGERTRKCMYVCVCICMFVRVYACVRVRYVCMCVCVFVFVFLGGGRFQRLLY